MNNQKLIYTLLCGLLTVSYLAPVIPLEAKKNKSPQAAIVQPNSPSNRSNFKGISHTIPGRWELTDLSLSSEVNVKVYRINEWHDPEHFPNITFFRVPFPYEVDLMSTCMMLITKIREQEGTEEEESDWERPGFLENELRSTEIVKINDIEMFHAQGIECEFTRSKNGAGIWQIDQWSRNEHETYMFILEGSLYIMSLSVPEGFIDQFTADIHSVINSVQRK